MKPDAHPVAVVVGAAIVAGALILVPKSRIDRQASTTPTTTHEQPATGVRAIPSPPIKEAEKEATWPRNNHVIAKAATALSLSRKVTTPTGSTSVSLVAKASTTSPAVMAGDLTDPYHDTMLPEGSKWTTTSTTSTTISAQATSTLNSVPNVRTTVDASATASRSSTSATVSSANVAVVTAGDTATTPPVPDWTRCSTSWTQTLTIGKNGEQIWTFSTTISDADVQDLATAVRWYGDIVARHPTVARNYAWLDCAGWRVRDYHQHGSNVPPADYYGAQGLDSPLGTCHSTTPFRRTRGGRCSAQSDALGCGGPGATSTIGGLRGVIGDDGKERGWVRYHSDWYVGVVEDSTCTDSCVAGFDHPCDLETERENPGQGRDVNGVAFFTWYWGGDVNGEPPW